MIGLVLGALIAAGIAVSGIVLARGLAPYHSQAAVMVRALGEAAGWVFVPVSATLTVWAAIAAIAGLPL